MQGNRMERGDDLSSLGAMLPPSAAVSQMSPSWASLDWSTRGNGRNGNWSAAPPSIEQTAMAPIAGASSTWSGLVNDLELEDHGEAPLSESRILSFVLPTCSPEENQRDVNNSIADHVLSPLIQGSTSGLTVPGIVGSTSSVPLRNDFPNNRIEKALAGLDAKGAQSGSNIGPSTVPIKAETRGSSWTDTFSDSLNLGENNPEPKQTSSSNDTVTGGRPPIVATNNGVQQSTAETQQEIPAGSSAVSGNKSEQLSKKQGDLAKRSETRGWETQAKALAVSRSSGVDGKYAATVKLRGLPFGATSHDVMGFLKGYNAVETSIRFGNNQDGRPSGEAWISFNRLEDAKRVVREKDRHHLGNRYVELFLLSEGGGVTTRAHR
uniref:RRM domain-containing protein n=1 Tax=Hanusia phi TaxID=3032 RepID=A0A7S0E1H1_9CRYP